MVKKNKAKLEARPPAASAAQPSPPKPAYKLTDEDRAKAVEAKRAKAPERAFNTRLSDAFRASLAQVDEALQETLAETVARRICGHLRTGRVTQVYRGLVQFVSEASEGRPAQAIVLSRKEDDPLTWSLEEIDAFEKFVAGHRRSPNDSERAYYREHGCYPSA